MRLDPENNGIRVARVSWDNVREGAMITDILPKLRGVLRSAQTAAVSISMHVVTSAGCGVADGITGKDKEAQKQFKSIVADEWKVTRSVASGK